MFNLSRLRLVTFDVTGTLLKFRSSPGKQYGEIGAIYGVLCDNNKLAENFKAQWHKMNKLHPNFGLHSGLGWDNWWRMIIHGTFADSKYCDDKKKLDAIATDLIETYKTSACWQLTYGSQQLLDYIKCRKVPMGIISNFDPRLPVILKNMKIADYFTFILPSYEAGFEKPEIEIFQKALICAKVPNIKPEEALHVGDTPSNDYHGAVDAGWNSILINDRPTKVLHEKYPELKTDHIFRSLYDFHKFLIHNDN